MREVVTMKLRMKKKRIDQIQRVIDSELRFMIRDEICANLYNPKKVRYGTIIRRRHKERNNIICLKFIHTMIDGELTPPLILTGMSRVHKTFIVKRLSLDKEKDGVSHEL